MTIKSNTLWLLAALALLPFMVTKQSLWIDEAQTTTFATLGNLQDLGRELGQDVKSEAMMPLSMGLAWFFVQILGSTELALRLPNLLYLAMGFYFIWRLSSSFAVPSAVLLCAVHPFIWYYADEARPYALQVGLGAGLVAMLIWLIESRGQRLLICWGFLGFGWLLSATSLLAVFSWATACVIVLVYFVREKWKIKREHLIWAGCLIFIFTPLAAYYIWVFQKGATGARIWDVGLSNIAFSIYEQLGFQGLGPGRAELREAARTSGGLLSVFRPFLAELLALAVLFTGILITGRISSNSRESERLILTGFLLILPAVILILLSIIIGFPFWGRHLAPVFPCFILLVCLWLHHSPWEKISTALLVLLGMVWLGSALQIRFSPRFLKDDYRSAAGLASEALFNQRVVWWAADLASARYYGLPVDAEAKSSSDNFVLLFGNRQKLEDMPEPSILFLSKPDIYDGSGNVRNFIQKFQWQKNRHFQSFDVYVP